MMEVNVESLADTNGQVAVICNLCKRKDLVPEYAFEDWDSVNCMMCEGDMRPVAITGGIRYVLRVAVVAVDDDGHDWAPYDEMNPPLATSDLDALTEVAERLCKDAAIRFRHSIPAESTSNLYPEDNE